MIAKDDTLRSDHSISARCDRILTLIEGADNRTELIAVFDDLAKFQSVAEPGQTYSLTQAFLRKLTPPLFGHFTETDFKTFFIDVLFLRSPHPATSLWALICSLSQCDDGGAFKFAKFPCGVLTDAEMMSVLLYYANPDGALPERHPLQFPTKRRTWPDPYKPKGQIMLTIDNVSEFARVNVNSRRVSEAVYIRGLSWKIKAISQAYFDQFGFYLQCNDENTDFDWSCAGSATFRIVSQKAGKEDHTRAISHHIFNSKQKGWGIDYFMSFEKLMDPKNGWYDAKDDTVILNAEVIAEEPIGVE
uniref:MATH domain-containing protein n=1 Tax=Globodera pallida TaxID=36090 RepID=A0A183CG82_GLOPA